jgi:hypothetical protein
LILWFVAVQVKSTTLEVENGGYACSVCTSGKPYAPGSFDFLAAYVIYDDAWYIIPAKEFLGQAWVVVYLSRQSPSMRSIARRGICSLRTPRQATLIASRPALKSSRRSGPNKGCDFGGLCKKLRTHMRPPGLKPAFVIRALRGAEAPLFHDDFLQ